MNFAPFHIKPRLWSNPWPPSKQYRNGTKIRVCQVLVLIRFKIKRSHMFVVKWFFYFETECNMYYFCQWECHVHFDKILPRVKFCQSAHEHSQYSTYLLAVTGAAAAVIASPDDTELAEYLRTLPFIWSAEDEWLLLWPRGATAATGGTPPLPPELILDDPEPEKANKQKQWGKQTKTMRVEKSIIIILRRDINYSRGFERTRKKIPYGKYTHKKIRVNPGGVHKCTAETQISWNPWGPLPRNSRTTHRGRRRRRVVVHD